MAFDRSAPRLARRVGEALFCMKCDGSGFTIQRLDEIDQPVKCRHCGGEGLEPKPQGEIMKLTEAKTVPTLGMADLSQVQRREIVQLVLKNHRPRDDVARRYNVSRPVVNQIVHQYLSTERANAGDSEMTRSVLAPRRFSWEEAGA